MARSNAQSTRIRPLDALRGIRALLKDPDDTEKVFDIIDALSGRAIERAFQRFESTETGSRLLQTQPDLVATLNDRERLLAMPAGTLGRAYGEFVEREQISADGLVDASEREREPDPSIPPKHEQDTQNITEHCPDTTGTPSKGHQETNDYRNKIEKPPGHQQDTHRQDRHQKHVAKTFPHNHVYSSPLSLTITTTQTQQNHHNTIIKVIFVNNARIIIVIITIISITIIINNQQT